MRIYGKTLTEIFRLLPLAYKSVVVLGTAFVIFAVPYSLNFFMNMGLQIERVEPLNFPGLGNAPGGVTDPAIASDGTDALLVHSAIIKVPSETGKPPTTALEVTMQKTRGPGCRSWQHLPGGFPIIQDHAVFPDGSPIGAEPGIWRVETPAVVYDPDDPVAKWKIYAYRYYWNGNENLARFYGVITEKHTAALDQVWSKEQYVFSAGPIIFNGEKRQQPPEPYASYPGLIQLNTLSPELADVYFYSRPSVTYAGKFLFMTLSAFTTARKTPDRVVMLYSIDHGKTWKYAGTPFRHDDLAKMGDFLHLGGATLLQYEGKIYLAGVFGDKTADGLGTFLMPFASPSKGLLVRDEKTGAPVVAYHHPRNSVQPSRVGGGFAAYTDACKIGMIMSEYSDIRESFQIFKTYKKPIPVE